MRTGYQDPTYLARRSLTHVVSLAIQGYAQSAPPRHHHTVLDVGGRGRPYAELFRTSLGAAGHDVRYVVVDPDPSAEVIGHAEALPIATGSVDVVLCTSVLEHVADPRRAVSEMARVLKPGGVCLLTTHGTWFYHPDPQDYWRWTPAGLANLFTGGGFEHVSVGPVGGTKLALAVLVMTAFERAAGAGIFGALVRRLLVAPVNFVGSRWLLRRIEGRTSLPGELVLNYLVTAGPTHPVR